jgi:hypothetical protein
LRLGLAAQHTQINAVLVLVSLCVSNRTTQKRPSPIITFIYLALWKAYFVEGLHYTSLLQALQPYFKTSVLCQTNYVRIRLTKANLTPQF